MSDTKVTPVALGEIITCGVDYAIEVTLTKDGATFDVSAATSVVFSIMQMGKTTKLIEDRAMTMSPTPASGVVTITLTDVDTALFVPPTEGAHLATIEHICDVKVVESTGAVVNCGPFTFDVRRPVTV